MNLPKETKLPSTPNPPPRINKIINRLLEMMSGPVAPNSKETYDVIFGKRKV